MTERELREFVAVLANTFDEVLFVRHAHTNSKAEAGNDRVRVVDGVGKAQCKRAQAYWVGRHCTGRKFIHLLADLERVHQTRTELFGLPATGQVILPVPELYYGWTGFGAEQVAWWEGYFGSIGYAPPLAYLQGPEGVRCLSWFDIYVDKSMDAMAGILAAELEQIDWTESVGLCVVGNAINQQLIGAAMALHWPGFEPIQRAQIVANLMNLNLGETCAFALSRNGVRFFETPAE